MLILGPSGKQNKKSVQILSQVILSDLLNFFYNVKNMKLLKQCIKLIESGSRGPVISSFSVETEVQH